LDGPQRAITHLRARRDGRVRSAVDLELPVMALLAVLVGIGVVVWLNAQGSPDSGEIRRVTARPQLSNPRDAIAAGQAKRAAAARAQARLRRAKARRLAERRAALAAAAARPRSDERFQQNGDGYGYYPPGTNPGLTTNGQTYTQQQVQRAPSPAPKSTPKPQPQPKPQRSGGGGGSFDDSG
jgi:hypothetical protein